MDYGVFRENLKVCVVGLGYVGLPLAIAFGKKMSVLGFDVDKERIAKLQEKVDWNNDVTPEEFEESKHTFSDDPSIISQANFIIIAVPTPLGEKNKPDLTILENASKLVGKHLTKNSIVAFESTVYPGATQEVCLPLLEESSGLKLDADFGIAYSPERMNPGDKEHAIDKIIKVVSGHSPECLKVTAEVYRIAATSGVHEAETIKVAEAAKIIENTQRDVNIALMNELSLIFEKLDINTQDVLKAARTKWNFVNFYPGLVGGHCIGVDPYYLAHKAIEVGHTPKVILSGRSVNDSMGLHVGELMVSALAKQGKNPANSKVLLMGLTFKEDVPDVRNSRASDVITILKGAGAKVLGFEPNVSEEVIEKEFGISSHDFASEEKFDGIIVINNHAAFKNITDEEVIARLDNGVVVDVKERFKRLKNKVRYHSL